ncbi:MAG: Asp-tRNA(Asn)/Glu-tRNA(Gln) amidotransferase subunit GatC [Pseudonocardiaceae bacterium]|nr:Asp-tRNA(Asn)/Glu-tRNA(Gln) amidotransferase subunit GatC [Pseudonocardiaceae bacterium]
MSTISRGEVARLAQLARLAVTESELDVFADQLDVILTSVARVGEVAADDIPPTSHAVPLTNVLRDDVVRPGLSQQQALAAAPSAEEGRFRVPRILAADDPQQRTDMGAEQS